MNKDAIIDILSIPTLILVIMTLVNIFKQRAHIRWLIRELVLMHSDEPSRLSKKRVESSVAFYTGLSGMITFFIYHFEKMSAIECEGWAVVLFGIAGYTVYKIEQAKKE